MTHGSSSVTQANATVVPRRTFLRSGMAVVAGCYLASAGVGTVSAQTDDNWPIQGYDPENTRYTTDTTPVKTNPAVIAEEDLAVGSPTDYLLAGSVAYLHTYKNGIGAINTGTGELLWQSSIDDVPVIPEGIAGDQLLARGTDGTVYTIDADTGEAVTEVPLEHGYGLGYGGVDQWFATLSAGKVVAGTVGSEEITWETDLEGVGVRPAVTDEHVFVSTIETSPSDVDLWEPESLDADGRLYALDITDGSVSWEASRVGAGIGAPAVRSGMVYWAGADGDLLTFDAETGDRGWEFKTNGSFLRSPAVTDTTVFVGSDDGYLYGVDIESGEQLGRLSAGAPISTSPVVVDDVVYIGSEEGMVSAFEYGGDGKLWEFDVGGTVTSLTPDNGRLIVGTEAGYHVLGSDESDGANNDTGASQSGADDGDGHESIGNDANEHDGRQRGLFSNGGDEPELVSNPVNLTMLGFLLSVAGIVYQMIQGR